VVDIQFVGHVQRDDSSGTVDVKVGAEGLDGNLGSVPGPIGFAALEYSK
jgi:hypothetical protein